MADQKNSKIKRQFDKWVRKELKEESSPVTERVIKKALSSVGIKISSIFDEKEALKVRLYVSELILKRSQCKVATYDEYRAVILNLMNFAEFLEGKDSTAQDEKKSNKNNTAQEEKKTGQNNAVPEGRDKLKDSLTVAYYLSRVNDVAIKELGYKTQRAAFEGLALIFGQKTATIKNMRDEFDPYFDNGRAGWYQREISPSRKEILDYYANVSVEELSTTVKTIVELYTPKAKKETASGDHKKIKITSGGMKEIKSGKKR